jgi:ketosteroid isomerase-like protein
VSIGEDEAADWLARYGRAWETGDVEGVGLLFTADASYRETPFAAPMLGLEAIRRYWREGAAEGQTEVRFAATVWAVKGMACFSHWQATLRRTATGEPVALDGAFRLVFERDPQGQLRCASLEEWWHRREGDT